MLASWRDEGVGFHNDPLADRDICSRIGTSESRLDEGPLWHFRGLTYLISAIFGEEGLVPFQNDEGNAPTQVGQAGAREGARRVIPWAELMHSVFVVDVLCGPKCGHRMTLISKVTDHDVVQPMSGCDQTLRNTDV